MDDEFDPLLFGVWPHEVIYDSLAGDGNARGQFLRAGQFLLEFKSAEEPPPDPVTLLNDMTVELHAQFDAFRAMRADAERELADSTDEVVIKLAQADIKAAVDAMSQIVRTLEKIDGLQRSIANDCAWMAEASFDKRAYKRVRTQLLDQLNARAEAIAEERFRPLAGGTTAARGPPFYARAINRYNWKETLIWSERAQSLVSVLTIVEPDSRIVPQSR